MAANYFFKGGVYALCLLATSSMASISLDSTRIIFSSAESGQGRSIGVTSSNDSTEPYLVKAQVLANLSGANIPTPFSVTPSLFRLEPGTTNKVRVLKTGNELLPQNQESLFYFRTISMPAGKGSENLAADKLDGSVAVSTGNVIKLFYRPAHLPTTLAQAMSGLTFSQNGSNLSVKNASPYYVTLNSLDVEGSQVAMSVAKQTTMIPPFGQMNYAWAGAKGKVTWQTINDYGGVETFHGTLQ